MNPLQNMDLKKNWTSFLGGYHRGHHNTALKREDM